MDRRVSLNCFWPLLAAALSLALRGPVCLSHAWENAGLVMLNRALMAAPPGSAIQPAAHAETLLRRASACATEPRSVGRGVGFALLAQGRDDEAVDAWRRSGVPARDFVLYGERARKTGQYQEALEWYWRAVTVEPGSGDPWYYTGLAYEGLGQLDEALAAYGRALETGSFNWVGQSSPYCRMGALYQERSGPQWTEEALAAYQAAAGKNEWGNAGLGTEHDYEVSNCYYEYGALMREVEGPRAANQYVPQFERALEVFPSHYRARVLLGAAYYERDGDVAAAEREISLAIQQSPESKRAYYELGSIYRREGMGARAVDAYSRILEVDPDDEKARQILTDLQGNGEGK